MYSLARLIVNIKYVQFQLSYFIFSVDSSCSSQCSLLPNVLLYDKVVHRRYNFSIGSRSIVLTRLQNCSCISDIFLLGQGLVGFSDFVFLGCAIVITERNHLMRSVGSHTESRALSVSCTMMIFPDLLLSFQVPGTLQCESNLI